jgi:hypothetical protein
VNRELLRRRDNRHKRCSFVIFIPHGPVNDSHPCASSSIYLLPEKAAPVALYVIEPPLSAREIITTASRKYNGYVIYSFFAFISSLLQKIEVLFDFFIPPAFRILFVSVTPDSPRA